jgi:medium-chain acyl-[acyl-carrier-protein] hydrolase
MSLPDRGGTQASSWFTRLASHPDPSLRLFCFPYAGGGAAIYRTWPTGLTAPVELYAAQLPGRGGRMREPPLTRLGRVVGAVSREILPFLDKPFAFFGHSMGALISFELARLLRRENGLTPAHLFVSGRRAPQLPPDPRITYNLPEPEFLEEVRRLDGTPKEVLEHPELMAVMSPLLRADFEVVETYSYVPEPPLDCPVTVFGGLRDKDVGREVLEPWREQTASHFTLRMLPGGHFFLQSDRDLLLSLLSEELRRVRPQGERNLPTS